MQSRLAKNPVKHLFLLIGTNPLPNYVAAKLLADSETHIYLVHSSGPNGTYPVATRLIEVLKLEEGSCTKVPVDEANPYSIYKQIRKYVDGKKGLGLNYTGGTKVMAVHAYQAIADSATDVAYSYLDARCLELVSHDDKRNFKREYVGDSVKITIKDLARMHGIPLVTYSQKPIQVDLCKAIAKLQCSGEEKRNSWREWIKKDKCKNLPAGDVFIDVLAAMQRVCGDSPLTEETLAQNLGYKSLPSLQKWFKAEWLENYAFHCVLQLIESAKLDDLSDYGINLECKGYANNTINELKFETDVVFILGYQLFIISCIDSGEKSECKKHLFEAYVRARQIGGDESRVCLVSGYDKPEDLQKEVEKSWDVPGMIRVMGIKHWPDLSSYIGDWVKTARRKG